MDKLKKQVLIDDGRSIWNTTLKNKAPMSYIIRVGIEVLYEVSHLK